MFVISCCAGSGSGAAKNITPQLNGQLSLSFQQNSAAGLPRSITLNRAGNVLYVTNSGFTQTGNINVYAVNAVGNINLLGSVVAGHNTQQLVLTPNQLYAYALNYLDNSISMYTVNTTTGLLSQLGQAISSEGIAPIHMVVNAQGDRAYVLNYLSENISIFTINNSAESSGVLTLQSTVNIGASAQAMTLSGDGRYLYIVNTAESGILVYAVESTSGNLTFRDSVPSGNNPAALVINNSVGALYVVNSADNSLSTYSVDNVSGDIALESTVSVGVNPLSLTMTANNKFLYVANFDGSNIAMYKIDGNTGLPVPLLPSSISLPVVSKPVALVSGINNNIIYVAGQTLDRLFGFAIQ